MGTVSRLPERIRTNAPIIESEADAFNAVHDLVRRFSAPDINGFPVSSPYSATATAAQTGLLGISVPPEFGGADVANAVLGEIMLKIATASRAAAAALAEHFYCIELLRGLSPTGPAAYFYARALAGDTFRYAGTISQTESIEPEHSKPGWRLTATIDIVGDFRETDWIVACSESDQGAIAVFLPRLASGLTIGPNRLIFSDVHVDNGCLIEIGDTQNLTAEPMGQLLRSAERLGWAERRLNDTLARHVRAVPQQKFGQRYLELLGLTVSRIENGKAAIERAGGKIDIAQVNKDEQSLKNASFSATIALSSAAEAFDHATELGRVNPQASLDDAGPVRTHGPDPYGHAPIGATMLGDSLH
ncbi:hypothetical protein JJB09_10690 [Rhizobium sp. KVB221]|uniref:Acyl-CoA dehydrogenase n=1 Tax=Rhizobium setariae TaxID=2801340 RepID=A0A936YT54_9HYPH|nr:hypothetical protein [Rhizobium setariae]MBL0372496.1 hypothetical protein [Rhizobium setariae]